MSRFDKVYDRTITGENKWNFKLNPRLGEDPIPMWVADMDFPVFESIKDAIKNKIDYGFVGYQLPSDSYYQAVVDWMKRRHEFIVNPNEIVLTPGVVMAIKIAIQAFSREGDSIIIQTPVYPPFGLSVDLNKRKKIEFELDLIDDHYECNFELFEKLIVDNKVKMFILCNPHNPIGKVWTKDELYKLGDICRKHGVYVVSDEIHSDFIFNGYKHIPFNNVDDSFKDFSVICTAPSKTFNLAALATSNIIIQNKDMLTRFEEVRQSNGVFNTNVMGQIACEVAYKQGDKWVDELVEYIEDNFKYVDNYLKTNLSKIKLIKAQGTYLAWLDCRSLELNEKELEDILVRNGLWFNQGYTFFTGGTGFIRVNLATQRYWVEKAMTRLFEAFK